MDQSRVIRKSESTLRRLSALAPFGPPRPPAILRKLDERLIRLLRANGIRLLRVVLGIVFLWFGALKLADVSPAAPLVAKTLPFLPADPTVYALGAVEILIGLGLLSGWAIRLTLLLFLPQMLGTLIPLVTLPGTVFEAGNPLRLSLAGEFVLKNFVLISAGLVILSASPTARGEERGRDTLAKKPDRATRSPGEGD